MNLAIYFTFDGKICNIKGIDSMYLSTFIYYFASNLSLIQVMVDFYGNQNDCNFETQQYICTTCRVAYTLYPYEGSFVCVGSHEANS